MDAAELKRFELAILDIAVLESGLLGGIAGIRCRSIFDDLVALDEPKDH